jgi:membrane protease YdiL (CAAX protease family)
MVNPQRAGTLSRLGALLLVTFALVLVANFSVFSPLGSLGGWITYAAILLVTMVAIWRAGLLPKMQARSKLATAETLVLVSVLIVYLSLNVTECRLPTFCISTDSSWAVVGLGAFIVGVGSNLFIGFTEELLFRGYLMHELIDNLRIRGLKTASGGGFPVQAICISAVLFALWHVPHYSSLATGLLLAEDLGEALAAGVMFGLVYWWTDWNLAVPIVSHFSFDAFGAVTPLAASNPSVTVLTLVGFPMIAIVIHTLAKRTRTGERASPAVLPLKDAIV